MVKRVMGGTSFVKLQDRSGQIQLMLKRDRLGEAFYAEFKKWDVGDIVAARGELIKTKTGELSVDVAELRLLVKSLRPLPEKWHGITDRRDEAAAALRRSHHERGDARGLSPPQRADCASSAASSTRSISPKSRRR